MLVGAVKECQQVSHNNHTNFSITVSVVDTVQIYRVHLQFLQQQWPYHGVCFSYCHQIQEPSQRKPGAQL